MVGTTSISLLLTLLTLGDVLADDQSPIVTLPQGTLRGQKVTPENLAPYYSFLGIPYAEPPVGELRFKAPVPAGPWNGTLEATEEGNMCKQPDRSSSGNIIGDEDCLYLNVYTPQLPDFGSLRPVLVCIHGGGFVAGSGNSEGRSPDFLLNTGIVYVSINYRLGILGFFSTGDVAAPGNAGMKDQVLALRWVQQNIAAFGGDPSKVTIFGESAGATSVHYHMLSPMSQGLFRAAIADSGSASITIAVAQKPRENAFLVGKALGFDGETSKDLVEFLRKPSAEELVATSAATINPEDQRVYHEAPTIECVQEEEESFMTENPLTLLEEGRFQKLPYLTGLNLDEGLLSTGILLGEGRTLEEIDEDFTKVFKPELRYCRDDPCGDEMIAKIRNFYLGEQPLSNDNLQNFIDMSTDIYFAEGGYYAVKTMSALSPEPVYFFHFIYEGALGRNYSSLNISGPGHGDELGYIFNTGVQVPDDSEAAKVRSRMVAMWANFVKTGNPTPEVTEGLPVWLPYQSNSTNFLEIGSELKAKKDYNKDRMDFWEQLYSSRRRTLVSM